MEYISPIQNDDLINSKQKIDLNDKIDLHENNMLEVLEDILEFSIDKRGFYLEKFPLNSNIGSIYDSKNSDSIFYIHKNNDEKFGISCEKIVNDYLHLDPLNWKKLSKNKNEIDLDVLWNKKKIKMRFKETTSIEELNRINKLFSENKIN